MTPFFTVLLAMIIVAAIGNFTYAMAQTENMAQKAPSPIEMDKIAGSGAFTLIGNGTFYLNGTDGHYWLKGTIKNISHVTQQVVVVSLAFDDKATGRNANFVIGQDFYNVNPNETRNFDINTGYTQKQSSQFPYLMIHVVA